MELGTPVLLREPPRSRTLGLVVAFGSVALCTAAIYPLKAITPDVSLGVAAFASTLAELGRARAQEADLRRREADLTAELAQVLLGRPNLDAELPVAAERIATALELPSAALQLDEAPDHPGRIALPLTQNDRRIGALVVPAGIDSSCPAARLVPGVGYRFSA